jgi:DNA-binding CsgD family transcriptional regulator
MPVHVQVVDLGEPLKIEGDDSPESKELRLPATIDRLKCEVSDDDYGALGASFEFHVWSYADGGHDIALQAIRVGQPHARPDIMSGFPLSVAMVRDLPLARWEQAARGRVMSALATEGKVRPGDATEAPWKVGAVRLDQDQAGDDQLIYALYPDLAGDNSLSAQRRLHGLRHLVHVARDYLRLLVEGRSDPAAEIARGYGVSGSTARSWIYRARKEGFLAPAVGRTAGVDTNPDEMRAKAIGLAIKEIDRIFEETDSKVRRVKRKDEDES